jgi:hypothetical protein
MGSSLLHYLPLGGLVFGNLLYMERIFRGGGYVTREVIATVMGRNR